MASDAEAYDRGVKISQTGLIPNFRDGVQANPWFQLGWQMGGKYGPRAAGMMSRAKSEFPVIAAKLQSSRPGAKDMMAVGRSMIGHEMETRMRLKGGREIKIIRTPTADGAMWSIPEMPEIKPHKNIAVIRQRLREKGYLHTFSASAKDMMAVEDRFYFGKGRKERFASKEQAAAFIKQYKRNEDSNYHSENVVLLAKFMGNAKVAKLASLVQQINEVAGHMPQGVAQFQYRELHEPLWKQFIAQYGDLYRSMK